MVLVYVEEPSELAQQALAFARGLGGPLHAFTAGVAVPVEGVETLYVAEGDAFASYAPAAIAQALVELVERLSPAAVVAAGTERGNEVLAHVAAKLDLPFSANCVAATAGDPFLVTRVRWGGSLLEEAHLHGPVKLLTVQPHVVEAEERTGRPAIAAFTPVLSDSDRLVRVAERVAAAGGGVVARRREGGRLLRPWSRLARRIRDYRGARGFARWRGRLLARGDDGRLAATYRPGGSDGDQDRA